MKKTALICGISGQDGAYLTNFLLEKNYKVIGTSRDSSITPFINLEKFNLKNKVKLETMILDNYQSVEKIIEKYSPSEIYNLAGQTSVANSFILPLETMQSISAGVLNLLEAVRHINKKIKVYNSGSGDCFGETAIPADENHPFRPKSPYGIAKAASIFQTKNYREAYDLFCCSGILFNHESPLRPSRFVTKKIIEAARNIKNGSKEKLTLGNIKITRDWGFAGDYVESMWKMLQMDKPEDYVIATGTSHTLENFVKKVFEKFNLYYKKYLTIDKSLYRPLDIHVSKANPKKANKQLHWQSKHTIDDLIDLIIKNNF